MQRTALSRMLCALGHALSLAMRPLPWLYPTYRTVMLWSADLDPEGRVWKYVD